jgi:uncharacterized membrane protein YqjE
MNSTHASSANPRLPPSASEKLALAWSTIRAMVQDHALLALLEVQQAGISLVKLMAAAIIISMLAITAWTGIVAAAVVWAVDAGASWGLAIFVAALLNIAAAVGIGFWAKKQVPDLLFAATMRQLRKDVPKENEHAPKRSVA